MGLVTTCIINSYAMRMVTSIRKRISATPSTLVATIRNCVCRPAHMLNTFAHRPTRNSMRMISSCICRTRMTMTRHFTNGKLCCTFPHINRNIRRHIIMRLIRTRIINCYAMAMTIIKINSSSRITTTVGISMPFTWRKISA